MADRKLSAVFSADVGGFVSNIHKAMRPLAAFEKSIKGMAKSLLTIPNMLAGALAGGSVIALVKSQMNAMDDLGDMAARIGMGSEALSQWQHVAKYADVETETLNNAFLTMGQNIGSAAGGMGKSQAIFRALGLDAKELATLAPEQAFMKIQGALQGLNGYQQKFAEAKIFGGTEIDPLVNMDANELKGKLGDAKSLGVGYNEDDIATAERANKAIMHIGESVKRLAGQFAIELGPVIEMAANGIESWANSATTSFGKANQSGGLLHTTFVTIVDVAQVGFGILQMGWATMNQAMFRAVGLIELIMKGLSYIPGVSGDTFNNVLSAVQSAKKEYEAKAQSSWDAGKANVIGPNAWSQGMGQTKSEPAKPKEDPKLKAFNEKAMDTNKAIDDLITKMQAGISTAGLTDYQKQLAELKLKLKETGQNVGPDTPAFKPPDSQFQTQARAAWDAAKEPFYAAKEQSLSAYNEAKAAWENAIAPYNVNPAIPKIRPDLEPFDQINARARQSETVLREMLGIKADQPVGDLSNYAAQLEKIKISGDAVAKLKLADALSAQADAATRAAESTKKLDDLIVKQAEDIKYFGMSDKRKELAKLEDQGGDKGKVAQAFAQGKELENLERQKEQRKKLWDLGNSVYQKTLTPADEYKKKLEEINVLQASRADLAAHGFDVSKLSDEALNKSRALAGQEYGKSLGQGEAIATPGAAMAGSKEAYSAILQAQLGGAKDEQIKNQRQQLETAIQHKDLFQQFLDFAKDNMKKEEATF